MVYRDQLLWRVLRFGNRVSNPLSQAAFTADGSGPGRLTAAIVQCSDAELAVNYSADVAGRYSLAIRCRSTGEVRCLFGMWIHNGLFAGARQRHGRLGVAWHDSRVDTNSAFRGVEHWVRAKVAKHEAALLEPPSY